MAHYVKFKLSTSLKVYGVCSYQEVILAETYNRKMKANSEFYKDDITKFLSIANYFLGTAYGTISELLKSACQECELHKQYNGESFKQYFYEGQEKINVVDDGEGAISTRYCVMVSFS